MGTGGSGALKEPGEAPLGVFTGAILAALKAFP